MCRRLTKSVKYQRQMVSISVCYSLRSTNISVKHLKGNVKVKGHLDGICLWEVSKVIVTICIHYNA